MGERGVRNAEVGGSSPPISTISSEYSWWGRGDSNSHALRAHDPKSCASAIPPLPQITYSNLILGLKIVVCVIYEVFRDHLMRMDASSLSLLFSDTVGVDDEK